MNDHPDVDRSTVGAVLAHFGAAFLTLAVLMLRTLCRRPLDSMGFILGSVAVGVVLINALFMQASPHPAPMLPGKPRPVMLGDADTAARPGETGARTRVQVVSDIQRELSRRGFFDGPVDGVYGAKTDAAIRDFEQAAGLKTSSQPDDALPRIIMRSRVHVTPATPPMTPLPVTATPPVTAAPPTTTAKASPATPAPAVTPLRARASPHRQRDPCRSGGASRPGPANCCGRAAASNRRGRPGASTRRRPGGPSRRRGPSGRRGRPGASGAAGARRHPGRVVAPHRGGATGARRFRLWPAQAERRGGCRNQDRDRALRARAQAPGHRPDLRPARPRARRRHRPAAGIATPSICDLACVGAPRAIRLCWLSGSVIGCGRT